VDVNCKQFKTTTDNNIWVYDDVFRGDELDRHKVHAQGIPYYLGWGTSPQFEQKNETFFRSEFLTPHHLMSFKLLFSDSFRPIYDEHFANKKPLKSWFLCSTQLTKYYFHNDELKENKAKTLLVYLNTKWDVDWGGETMFANNQGDVEIAVSCKPNRLVVFDSDTLHRPSATSADASQHRFTFVSIFK
jgi:Rps23 Pro-64 3,4-dihydroxylase Tpa1-like proline 4-hydroxylase